MQDFLRWVESKSQIMVTGYNKYGEITFAVDGRRYTYLIDAMYLYNKFPSVNLPAWIKYKPGKALNWVKQHGELIKSPDPQPESPEPKKQNWIQRELF